MGAKMIHVFIRRESWVTGGRVISVSLSPPPPSRYALPLELQAVSTTKQLTYAHMPYKTPLVEFSKAWVKLQSLGHISKSETFPKGYIPTDDDVTRARIRARIIEEFMS